MMAPDEFGGGTAAGGDFNWNRSKIEKVSEAALGGPCCVAPFASPPQDGVLATPSSIMEVAANGLGAQICKKGPG